MSDAIFHLGLLKNYQIVAKPGAYLASVAYTVTNSNLILDDYPRYLVPLRVMNSSGLDSLLSILEDESEIISFSSVKKYFLSGVLWFSDIEEENLPVKGERVMATFDDVDGKLLCIHIELLPREELDYIDINNIIDFRKTLLKLLQEKN